MNSVIIRPPSIEDRLITLVTNGLTSEHSRRAYREKLTTFLAFCAARSLPFTREAVQAYRAHLEDAGKRASTINVSLAAIKTLAKEALLAGNIDRQTHDAIREVKSIRSLGSSCGVWLNKNQMRALLAAPDRSTLAGRRDYCLFAVLLGCGLRRSEAAGLMCDQIQRRADRLCIVDILGKGGRMRTLPLPTFSWEGVEAWAREVGSGYLLRSITRKGVLGERLDDTGVQYIVHEYAKRLGLKGLAPHSLRRSWAEACLKGGAQLREIQKCLGHESLQTTQRYFSRGVDLENPACEMLGI